MTSEYHKKNKLRGIQLNFIWRNVNVWLLDVLQTVGHDKRSWRLFYSAEHFLYHWNVILNCVNFMKTWTSTSFPSPSWPSGLMLSSLRMTPEFGSRCSTHSIFSHRFIIVKNTKQQQQLIFMEWIRVQIMYAHQISVSVNLRNWSIYLYSCNMWQLQVDNPNLVFFLVANTGVPKNLKAVKTMSSIARCDNISAIVIQLRIYEILAHFLHV